MSTKNYTSIYDIKEFAATEIIPKFFDTESINTLNIGFLGYVNEVISGLAEDTFNSMNFLLNEMYPNKAKMMETIYSYLSLFRFNQLFATPAVADAMLFVAEDDIIQNAEVKTDDVTDVSTYTFYLDKDMVIEVDGKNFMMDYNLKIQAKFYNNDWIFQAEYVKDYNNCISKINSPYLTSKRVIVEGKRYLAIGLSGVHQVTKVTEEFPLISNDILNIPTFSFTYSSNLCGFNAFYKESDDSKKVQMEIKMRDTPPIIEPFCYYQLKNNNTVEITFTPKDDYFQPVFGSVIVIERFESLADKGNFDAYKGTNIIVKPSSEVYDYNNGLILYATIRSSSKNGKLAPTENELRNKASELFTTSNVISTEEDLQQFFLNFENSYGNTMMFDKLRDDALCRTFNGFLLLKNGDNIYDTNTLDMNFSVYNGEFDVEYEQSNRWIINPGRVFRLKQGTKDVLVPIDHLTVMDDLSFYKDIDIYSNPFLISMCKRPQSVSFYLNSIDKQVKVDYKFANDGAFYQFNCTRISLYRNAIAGSKKYIVNVGITPSTEIPDEIVTVDELNNMIDNGKLKMILTLYKDESRIGYYIMDLDSYTKETDSYNFSTEIETDDYITEDNCIRITNARNWVTGEIDGSVLVPMEKSQLEVSIFYRDETDTEITATEVFSHIPEIEGMELTNIYITDSERFDYMTEMSCIDSTLNYTEDTIDVNEIIDDRIERPTGINIAAVPSGSSHNVFVRWDKYVDESGCSKSSYLIAIDEDYENATELTNGDYTVSDDKCEYNIPNFDIHKKISVGYKVTGSSSFDTKTYSYSCGCRETQGIEHLGEVCPSCGTKVIQFLESDAFSYGCECGSIKGKENVGFKCRSCNTYCIQKPILDTGYSCDCGLMVGRHTLGRICKKCNSPVVVDEENRTVLYTCQCGNLYGIENHGNECEDCHTICKRTYSELKNKDMVITWSLPYELEETSMDGKVYPNPTESDIPPYDENIPNIATGNILTHLVHETVNSFFINLKLVPIVAAHELMNDNHSALIENISSQIDYMDGVFKRLINNFGISLKFYNTYGYAKWFTTENGTSIGSLDLKLYLNIKVANGVIFEDLSNDIKIFIKNFIENSSSVSNELYVSNLTTAIENQFSNVVYCKFLGYNDFTPDTQMIINNSVNDMSKLSKDERLQYIPEFLTIKLENIILTEV